MRILVSAGFPPNLYLFINVVVLRALRCSHFLRNRNKCCRSETSGTFSVYSLRQESAYSKMIAYMIPLKIIRGNICVDAQMKKTTRKTDPVAELWVEQNMHPSDSL